MTRAKGEAVATTNEKVPEVAGVSTAAVPVTPLVNWMGVAVRVAVGVAVRVAVLVAVEVREGVGVAVAVLVTDGRVRASAGPSP